MSKTKPRTIFVTGATGFIGNRFLSRLNRSGQDRILCLTRASSSPSIQHGWGENVEWISGELGEVGNYANRLGDADIVFHLAAATGAASVHELREVNQYGTEALVSACREAAVAKFVYMSSIAVNSNDIAHYPYAQTKLAAEQAVRDSGLDWVIVRPTIVLGEGAANWQMLRQISCLPVVPLFGGGTAKIQPVDVDDVATGLQWINENGLPSGSILEIGGPEVLTFADFLARIRAACGRGTLRGIRLPVTPVRLGLSLVERLLGSRTPIRPGQLVPFISEGVAEPNALVDLLRPDMLPVDDLLQRIVRADQTR